MLKDIIARSGVSPDYLWRCAKKKDPKLRFKLTAVKPEFTDKELRERVLFCYKLLAEPPEWLHGMVWIDESSVPLCPMPYMAIGRAGAEILVTDKRKPHHAKKTPWIHYLLAVNWAVGLVKMDILSFTPGFNDTMQFYVSAPPVQTPAWPTLGAVTRSRLL